MRTQAQIEASRKNGANSKGPKTAEGRARSSQNAFRHGLAADKFVVLDGESTSDWDLLYDAYILKFQPRDLVEETLVLEMAANQWRLARAWRLQTSVIDQGSLEQKSADQKFRGYDNILLHSFAYASRAKELATLDQYATRLSRNFDRALKKFNQIRQQHPAPPVLQNEPEEESAAVHPAEPAARPDVQKPCETTADASSDESHANPENEPKDSAPAPASRRSQVERSALRNSLKPIAAITILCLLPLLR